jgi:hypothetical protein
LVWAAWTNITLLFTTTNVDMFKSSC